MLNPAVMQFMSKLILCGHECQPEQFKKHALGHLKELIPFDAALWTSGSITNRRIHNYYLEGLPHSLMESWEKIKYQDRLIPAVAANPGMTIDIVDLYTAEERRDSEVYQRHSKQFGIEAVICTALPDPEVGLFEAISLYRRQAKPGFSEKERLTKQSLFPLISQVWHHNQIQQLKQICGGQPGGSAAICDSYGWLRHVESRFVGLLRGHFPGWMPPELPKPLRSWLANSEPETFRAGELLITRKNQDDLILLQVQTRGALADLTPREEQIAQSYGLGLTYREISQELGLAPSTVRRHLESVYRKLGISTKVELTRILG